MEQTVVAKRLFKRKELFFVGILSPIDEFHFIEKSKRRDSFADTVSKFSAEFLTEDKEVHCDPPPLFFKYPFTISF